MPRDGSGAGDNAIEAEHNITHGDGGKSSSIVDRSDKAAPAPEIEGGEGLKNPDGTPMTSGGTGIANPGSGATGSGKGPLQSELDEAK